MPTMDSTRAGPGVVRHRFHQADSQPIITAQTIKACCDTGSMEIHMATKRAVAVPKAQLIAAADFLVL